MAQKEKIPRKQQREEARQKARALMEETKRKEKRTKLFIQGGIVLAIVAVIAIVVLVIANQKPPAAQANPTNMISNGVVLTDNAQVVSTAAIPKGGTYTPTTLSEDKVHIDVYVDYLCPFCKLFEETQNDTLLKYMQNSDVEVEYHPLGMIAEYSAVTANASACVASLQPELWWKANNALYATQPEESVGQNYSKKQSITSILKTSWTDLPISNEVKDCVQDTRFYDWAMLASQEALTQPLPNSSGTTLKSTPTVLIDGVLFAGNWRDEPRTFSAAIDSALEAKGLK